MELVPTKQRECVGLLYQLTYSLSILISVGAAYQERRWRRLNLFIAAPSLVAIVFFWALPESPRWLLAIGHKEKAECIMRKIAKYNRTSFKTNLKSSTGQKDALKTYSYLDLFRYKKTASVTLAQCLLWTTSSMLYLAIGLESSKLGGDMYTLFLIMTLIDLPAGVTPIFLLKRGGRKKVIVGSIFAGALFVGGIALIPKSFSMHHHMLPIGFALAAKFFATISYNSLYVWTFEIYPTVIRSQGLSFCNIFERLGCLFSPFLVGMLQNVNYKLPFITMSVVAICATFVGLILPETKGSPTREAFEDFFKKKSQYDLNEIGVQNVGQDSIEL